jgi:hypothetical protein
MCEAIRLRREREAKEQKGRRKHALTRSFSRRYLPDFRQALNAFRSYRARSVDVMEYWSSHAERGQEATEK